MHGPRGQSAGDQSRGHRVRADRDDAGHRELHGHVHPGRLLHRRRERGVVGRQARPRRDLRRRRDAGERRRRSAERDGIRLGVSGGFRRERHDERDRHEPGQPHGIAGQFTGNGTAPDNLKYLYPYAATVFPRAVAAPTVQWDNLGVPATAVKVTIQYPATGTPIYTVAVDPARVDARRRRRSRRTAGPYLDQTAAGKDALISIQRLVGGVLRNPVTETIHFASRAAARQHLLHRVRRRPRGRRRSRAPSRTARRRRRSRSPTRGATRATRSRRAARRSSPRTGATTTRRIAQGQRRRDADRAREHVEPAQPPAHGLARLRVLGHLARRAARAAGDELVGNTVVPGSVEPRRRRPRTATARGSRARTTRTRRRPGSPAFTTDRLARSTSTGATRPRAARSRRARTTRWCGPASSRRSTARRTRSRPSRATACS